MVSTQGYTNREIINRLIRTPSLDLWQVKLQCSEEIIIFLRNGARSIVRPYAGKEKKKKQQTLFRILHHKEISNAGDYRPKCEKLKKKTF